jgi:alpha-beta hydrolase superfamily lysophospholipase
VTAREGEAATPRSFRRWRALAIALAVIGLVAATVATVRALQSKQAAPSADAAFYTPPDPLPEGPPGGLLRSERVAGDAPANIRAYRLLYRSRGHNDRPVAMSALLFVPRRAAPSNGRNVIALAHGTVGVAPRCGISRDDSFFGHVDGLRRFIRAGYAVVVPDYEGLGADGTHPYLVGDATARAMLDAVRATRRFDGANASERFVAWGVGQGGHAALFTAQEASAYAPELELAGVAAGAPYANVGRLVDATAGTPAGDILAGYILSSWREAYPQLRIGQILTPPGRETLKRVSALCVPVDHAPIGPALGDRDPKLEYRSKAPWRTGQWSELLARNSAGLKTISVPVIITQGTRDAFVRPRATARFVRYLCSQGATVQYRPSAGVAHRDLGEKTAPYVSKWIGGRFAGETARTTC